MEWIHVRRLKTLSLRPIQWVYGLILITVLSFLGFAWHSIQAFDDKVYSLREGYLNEITHALAGPLAVLEDIGMNDQASLGRVFAPFSNLRTPELYDVEANRQRVLHLLVTNRQGQVIFDSTGEELGLNIADRPEVLAALSGNVQRRDEDLGRGIYRMYVGIPIRHGDTLHGALIASKSNILLKPLVDAVEQGMLFILLAFAAIVLLMLLTAYLLLYRPIELWLGRLDLARGGTPVLRPNLRRRRFGRIGILLDRVHETISEKRHMEQMVACLAHEMKNPINAVRIHAELLGRVDKATDRQRLILEIKSCCDRMTNVTERLLVIAAIERRESLEALLPIRIGDLLENVLSTLRDTADRQGISLHTVGVLDRSVRCEPVLIELAIGNLIQNAIDHSPSGRDVVISVMEQGGTVAFEVRDQGNGIPDHAIHQVFDKYFTLPKASTGRKGTGIGLNVVQHVADLHCGEITLKNHPEGGVLAIFTLPI
ncbi:MAG: hypothetical protein RLZ25_314 [Pseudomonadota bacterium]|jgi:two-component system sensor histidine kinase CreC